MKRCGWLSLLNKIEILVLVTELLSAYLSQTSVPARSSGLKQYRSDLRGGDSAVSPASAPIDVDVSSSPTFSEAQ